MQGNTGETDMEAKSVARSTPSGSDFKKADSGSKFSRYSRKREGSSAGRPKNDPQPRKQGASKARGYDKRPQSRGYANANPRSQVTEAPEAEFGSALQTGSKKGNLNHLLNFTFAPREGAGGGGASWKNRNNWGGKKFVKYNKEQFLQANCQFVVLDTGDYTLHAAEPDMLVDWDLVQQVRIQSHEVPNCPICLYPPVAAKLTRCGHIYCWTCLLHYLALGEKSWRKCPICYEAVHQQDLKSVVALKTRPYTPGDQVTMVLMKRERGTTYAMPKSQWQARDAKPHAVDDDVDTRFLKLLCASIDHVQKIIDIERKAILQQISEEAGTESIESSFNEAALGHLEEREKGLQFTALAKAEVESLVNVASNNNCFEDGDAASLLNTGGADKIEEISAPSRKVDVQYASAFDNELVEPGMLPGGPEESDTPLKDESLVVEDRHRQESESSEEARGIPIESSEEARGIPITPMKNMSMSNQNATPGKGHGGSKMTDIYYFYQATDGQHIYLNSLNARCLIKEYGSLEKSPECITATIVNVESISMTEDLRRRLKYLGHLPLTCEFQIAELALKPPVISGGTIRAFSDEIENRRKMRQKKARQEKRAERRVHQDPGMKARLTSTHHFPAFGIEGATERPASPVSDVSTPLGSPPAVNLNPFALEFTPGSPFTPSSLDNGNQTATVSFAQMLRQGQRKPPEAWPKTGTTQEDLPKVVHAKKPPASDESDSEDRVPVPQFQDSFGSAIQQALDNYSCHAAGNNENGGKKKKKKQKKLLFATTMARK